MTTFRIIGPGRAGTSLAAALDGVAGFESRGVLRPRRRPSGRPPAGVDVLVIATPDDAIAEVAAAGRARCRPPRSSTSPARSGSTCWPPIARAASLHPLVPLPNPRGRRGPAALRASPSPWPATRWPARMAEALGGRTVEVADDDRAAYHAAACIAANHVVALLGQVERVAASVGLALEAFAGLLRAAIDDVAGPRAPSAP